MSTRKNLKNVTEAEPGFVTVDTLKEMLDQQKTFYEEVLKRQEASFRCFTQMILDSTNNRIDGIMREIQDLSNSLQYSRKDIEEIKEANDGDKKAFKDLEQLIKQLDSIPNQSDRLLERLDYLESQSRRNNIIIDGISLDHAEETWAETESKVRELLTTKLKLEANSIHIEQAHRRGKFREEAEKPRSIVVKLLSFKEKTLIMEKARAHLKNTSVYINEDFSEKLRKKRAELLPAMKEARAKVFPVEVQQLSVSKDDVFPRQQEESSSLNQEISKHLKIKDEPDELWCNQARERIHGLEEDDMKLTFVPVPVKSEDDEEKPQSSQLHQEQTKQLESGADGEDCGDTDRDLQQQSEVKTDESSDPETDDSADWREMTEDQSDFKAMENSRKRKAKTKNKLHHCSECGKGFNYKMDLTRHMVVHTKEKLFSCSVCDQRFTQKGSVTVHMRIHTGEKPFGCSVCGMRFTKKGDLTRHTRTHERIKPFVCSHRGKGFHNKMNLMRHVIDQT
ncbi:histone-lysine N-methyltransferase PRDM9-like isoform X1 [Cheilinus undulatus]|uniref:histone-lysine N-methyltransferase PRDM9-like isoform X1 n=1 Tax=Cheilinus undulatus TaxID=241271 RepID=UPI001BD6C7F3|nr:histone-lysine N-methyltransferase PRDM9-like isoform X1 [Cheilinus undulatus]